MTAEELDRFSEAVRQRGCLRNTEKDRQFIVDFLREICPIPAFTIVDLTTDEDRRNRFVRMELREEFVVKTLTEPTPPASS